ARERRRGHAADQKPHCCEGSDHCGGLLFRVRVLPDFKPTSSKLSTPYSSAQMCSGLAASPSHSLYWKVETAPKGAAPKIGLLILNALLGRVAHVRLMRSLHPSSN